VISYEDVVHLRNDDSHRDWADNDGIVGNSDIGSGGSVVGTNDFDDPEDTDTLSSSKDSCFQMIVQGLRE
jgi:hypothetical protein